MKSEWSLFWVLQMQNWCFKWLFTCLNVHISPVPSQNAPSSRRNLRGPKRFTRTWTGRPFHLQSRRGSGTDWLRHLLLGNMFSISELYAISGQEHWDTIVPLSSDSQGIPGLLAKQCVIHVMLKNWDSYWTLQQHTHRYLLSVAKMFEGLSRSKTVNTLRTDHLSFDVLMIVTKLVVAITSYCLSNLYN